MSEIKKASVKIVPYIGDISYASYDYLIKYLRSLPPNTRVCIDLPEEEVTWIKDELLLAIPKEEIIERIKKDYNVITTDIPKFIAKYDLLFECIEAGLKVVPVYPNTVMKARYGNSLSGVGLEKIMAHRIVEEHVDTVALISPGQVSGVYNAIHEVGLMSSIEVRLYPGKLVGKSIREIFVYYMRKLSQLELVDNYNYKTDYNKVRNEAGKIFENMRVKSENARERLVIKILNKLDHASKQEELRRNPDTMEVTNRSAFLDAKALRRAGLVKETIKRKLLFAKKQVIRTGNRLKERIANGTRITLNKIRPLPRKPA